jgi:hypothetical protein
MKKTPRRLVLRSETLRMLANMDLVRAVGGFDSGAATRPNQAVDTGDKACEAPAGPIATGACR